MMPQLVQPLEPRRLLSASPSLPLDEGKLALDVHAIIADAKSAKTALVADGHAVVVQLKALKLQTAPLRSALSSAIAHGKQTVNADIAKIISVGAHDGQKVFGDWLKTEFADSKGSPKLAADQAKLATDVSALWTVEQPLANKLEADIEASATNVSNAVQAIVNANKSDDALNSAWNILQGEITSSEQTLSADFSQLTVDADAVVADLS
jgi:hypothetical protein